MKYNLFFIGILFYCISCKSEQDTSNVNTIDFINVTTNTIELIEENKHIGYIYRVTLKNGELCYFKPFFSNGNFSIINCDVFNGEPYDYIFRIDKESKEWLSE
jgi:hypothetical protein